MTEPTPIPLVTSDNEQPQDTHQRIAQTLANLKVAGDAGASWFFWIAALSLVNTAITHMGGDRQFIVGLAVTAIVDAVAAEIGKQQPEAATVLTAISVGFSVFISIVVVLCGWLSRKRLLWVFGFGMFLYLLDGLLYLMLGIILSAGFHGFALFSMWKGFNSYRQMNKLEHAAAMDAAEPLEAEPEQGFETA